MGKYFSFDSILSFLKMLSSLLHIKGRMPERCLCEVIQLPLVFCQTNATHQWLLVIIPPPSSLHLSPLSALPPLPCKLLSDDANCLFAPGKLALLGLAFPSRNPRNPLARPCSATVPPWGWYVTRPCCCVRAHILQQTAHHPVLISSSFCPLVLLLTGYLRQRRGSPWTSGYQVVVISLITWPKIVNQVSVGLNLFPILKHVLCDSHMHHTLLRG